ncbi:MAG: succinate dehydrogenase, hydrophobic membrane anchor protein [Candidatus Aminicenantes bacterium]|jgi:succinate dehydrogenase / fumarate reductase membrane anchor subunit|nr:succinate dehydrogenase, hydrophobic membrane anchor protein [Candidatus Aminicenantes bacterium]
MKKNFKETSKTGALAWLLQRISAIFIFAVLIYHFFVYHCISQGKAPEWADVVAKMKSPWFNLLQFLFLLAALYHGLNGVWMVVEDYIHSRFWRIFIFSIIVLVGTSLLFVGTLTLFKVANINPGV